MIDTFDELLKFWKLTKQTYDVGDINKPMYYYLTLCIVVVAGMYMYLVWEGFFALAVLFSNFAGVSPPSGLPPISVVGAVGIIMIIRYSVFGAIESLAKAPKALEERMALLEDKVNDLHKLAFGDVEEVVTNTREIKSEKNPVKKATIHTTVVKRNGKIKAEVNVDANIRSRKSRKPA